jgi:hypothetical protein
MRSHGKNTTTRSLTRRWRGKRATLRDYDMATTPWERQVRGDSHRGRSWNYGERACGDDSAMPSTYDEGGGRDALVSYLPTQDSLPCLCEAFSGAAETLQKRLCHASDTPQKHSGSHPHLHLYAFSHRGEFHDQ